MIWQELARSHSEFAWRQVDGVVRTRQAFVAWIASWAKVLEDANLPAGSAIGYIADARGETLEFCWAAILMGCWPVLLEPQSPEAESLWKLEVAGARAIAGAPTQITKLAARARLKTAPAPTSLTPLDAAPQPMLTSAPGWPILFSGGSTGKPKAVRRFPPATLEELFTTVRGSAEFLGLGGEGRHLLAGPLYHAAPLLFAMYAQAAGSEVAILGKWDSEKCIQALRAPQTRSSHLVPTMLRRLEPLAREAGGPPTFRHLRTLLHGAAPYPVAEKQAAIDALGPTLVEYWGATETGICTLISSREWQTHPGSVGKAVPWMTVEPVEAGDVDTQAELRVRHRRKARVFEYLSGDDVPRSAQGGWIYFGDLGRICPQGFIYLEGRRSDLILCGGVNLYPLEIEEALRKLPEVSDVAVVGLDHADLGQIAAALIVAHQGLAAISEAEVRLGLRPLLRKAALPRRIAFSEKIPRRENGKLHRARIRQYFERKANPQ